MDIEKRKRELMAALESAREQMLRLEGALLLLAEMEQAEKGAPAADAPQDAPPEPQPE